MTQVVGFWLDEGILRSVAIDFRVRWMCFYCKAVPYAVRFRASDLFFSISRKNDPADAVRICKVRPDFFRFENPMTQVVEFWAKIRRLGSSYVQIEK